MPYVKFKSAAAEKKYKIKRNETKKKKRNLII